jgi:hypothetical protein
MKIKKKKNADLNRMKISQRKLDTANANERVKQNDINVSESARHEG